MDGKSDPGKKTARFTYTPLLKNPVSSKNVALGDYYYVGLIKISVGGKKVELPHEFLAPDSDGNGGTIVDSGSTFAYMNPAAFKAVTNSFAEQVKNYKRAKNVENLTVLRPCFDVTGHEAIKFPELKLHFKGGAEMGLPLENYFFVVKDDQKVVVCLTTVTDNTLLGPELVSGPSIILGNFLMQNFHVEFDSRALSREEDGLMNRFISRL